MQITFCGAAGTVTGSCYWVKTETASFLVDCGMFQGNKEIRNLNKRDFLFNPADLDFMLLTHAHVDHAGLIPRLCNTGFRKPIYATKATVELSAIVLPDSGHIQEMEMEWRNRKRSRTGAPQEEPLYTAQDALNCLKLFQAKNYLEEFEPFPGIRVRFSDAGHILGSAIVEVFVKENDTETKVVFSGDLGQTAQPIIRDPSLIRDADYVLVESTYGNRLHENGAEKTELLRKLIIESIRSGGNLVIPAFAVGRTQDLLYHIRQLLHNGQIPRVPVYIDSPMAVSVTEIYRDNPDCYDEETRQLFAAHQSPFEFPNLHFIRTADESRQLNDVARGAIIIAASGMCEAGRILHHLKHNLWRPESHILFVGYQAEATLGRRLLDGAKVVKIMGEEIGVQAKIHSIGGFSAHADQNGLMEWLRGFTQKKPRNVFIVHGEQDAQRDLAGLIKNQLGLAPLIPGLGESYTLEAVAAVQQRAAVLTLPDYRLDRSLTDLEHLILNLHNQIRQKDYPKAGIELEDLKRLLGEVESLLKNSA